VFDGRHRGKSCPCRIPRADEFRVSGFIRSFKLNAD
jgi:hypothetical protein